jgi:very-short-patch-repair endonuclease
MPASNLAQLENELREALSSPNNLFQRIWRRLHRRRLASRHSAALNTLLNLPMPTADQLLPDLQTPITVWTDFFGIWHQWIEAAQVLALVRACEHGVAQLPTSNDCTQRLALAQQSLEKLTQEWMAWASGGLPNVLSPADRQAIANLRAGIQNWGVDRFAKELRQHFPLVLNAFPLWSVSNLSARSSLPLLPALYDLVIVDEASQCDIASVIPLLARSRNAVFAGDPMQLRHISSLDVAVEQTLLSQYALTDSELQRFTYRVNSAFELADSTASIPSHARVRLDLHFRSHDLIADYCNDAFYSNTLSVVTVTERLNIPAGMKPGIHWTQVAGKIEAGTTGSWCADEINRVCQELRSLVKSGYQGTIGVVTPFRQQMTRLRDALESNDSIPRDFMERVHFLASTAHGFQGDERDLIFFSLCGGPDMPEGSTIFLRENPNLFNVAVSRARAVLHIIGNRDWALESGVSFIEKLARRTLPGDHSARNRNSDLYQSPWERKLHRALLAAGIHATLQYPIAGRFLDLALLGPVKLDIEVDGESVHRTAAGGRKDDDYWRDLQLQSLGWKVIRFWVYELREDMPRCVQLIIDLSLQARTAVSCRGE